MPKPDPSSLRAVADALGVPVEECIMLDDYAADIGAAQNAAAVCIGVAWSGHAPKSWRRRWPDVAVACPDRLLTAP